MSVPSIHEKSDSSEGHALGDSLDVSIRWVPPSAAAAVFALSAALSLEFHCFFGTFWQLLPGEKAKTWERKGTPLSEGVHCGVTRPALLAQQPEVQYVVFPFEKVLQRKRGQYIEVVD